MVTIQEINQRQQELDALENQANQILSQNVPARRFGAGVTPKQQQTVISNKQEAQRVLNQIKDQRIQLAQAKGQLQTQDQAVNEFESYNRDLQEARNFAGKGVAPFGANKRVRDLYSQLVSGRGTQEVLNQRLADLKARGLNPIIQNGKIIAFNDTVNHQSIPISAIPTLIQQNPSNLQRFSEPGVVNITLGPETSFGTSAEQQAGLSLVSEHQQVSQNAISSVQRPSGFLEGLQYDISNQQAGAVTESLRNQGSNPLRSQALGFETIALGFAKGGIEQALFLENLAIHPIKTSKATFLSIENIIGKVISGEGFPQVGQELVLNPGGVIGEASSYIILPELIGKGTKLGVDLYRRTGLIELPAESIIAPEYFQGQIYPGIKKGQSAGELLKEFNQAILPTDIAEVIKLEGYSGKGKALSISESLKLPVELPRAEPAGFTALPNPPAPETIRGGSELPGLYQAPKLSPKFLGISGEGEKLFSFNPFSNLRPSAIRITPESFELIPGVDFGETIPSGGFKKRLPVTPRAKEILNLFENKLPKGKSFIPFIKTEKEAIIPFETSIQLTGKRYFFKFEGRSVPILEFKTITEVQAFKSFKLGKTTVKEVSKYYYESYSSPKFNILNVRGSYSYKQSSRGKSYGSISSSLNSYLASLSSGTSYNSRSSSSSFSGRSYSIPSVSKSYSFSSFSARYSSSKSSSTKSFSPRYFSSSKTISVGKQRARSFKFPSFLVGFRTFVIKSGKKVYLPGIRSKGKALKFGQNESLTTLRATFGVQATNVRVSGKDIGFSPLARYFRGFKISKGRRIPLKDTFIQKRGKRLVTIPEIASLQRARRLKI